MQQENEQNINANPNNSIQNNNNRNLSEPEIEREENNGRSWGKIFFGISAVIGSLASVGNIIWKFYDSYNQNQSAEREKAEKLEEMRIAAEEKKREQYIGVFQNIANMGFEGYKLYNQNQRNISTQQPPPIANNILNNIIKKNFPQKK